MDPEQETSYGIIPLKREGEDWQVLLIKHHAGHWSFPKGHPEKKEIPLESAKRELFEETGLKVKKILRETPLKEAYRFKRSGRLIDKKVEYFLAEVEGETSIQTEELTESRWVPISDAARRVTFPEGKRICSEILNFVITH
ncbi:MAG: bis(5'-nucleosyl)-tetraphosphatase [Waddliaceae bacterium]